MMTLRRFLHDKRGNFAITATLLAVPLVFSVGAAIDLSRGYNAKTKLQSAVDGAALAVVKDSGFSPEKAREIATQMLLANYGADFGGLDIDLTGNGAKVTAETRTATTLTSILGFRELVNQVSGTVQYPQTRYEIVLVLDTTGSMAGAKIEEMKKAATQMIEELSATPILRDRVRFALVPFSTAVNVGPDKADAAWIDREGKVYLPNSMIPKKVDRLQVFANLGGSGWKGCVETRIEEKDETFATDDATPTEKEPRSLFVPMLAPDEPGDTNGARPLYPNNYVTDDTLEGLGVTVVSNGVGIGVDAVTHDPVPLGLKVPGSVLGGGSQGGDPNQGCDARPITALTSDADRLKREIGLLQPRGSTNITEGVAWGQRVLSPGEPFTEGADADTDVEKIMVVLTDGDNTITAASNPNGSYYSSYGYLADGRWNDAYKTDKTMAKCRKEKKVKSSPDDEDDEDDVTKTEITGCARAAVTPATAGTATEITTAMNTDTTAACEIAKENVDELYAIRLEVNTATSSTLLSNCASDGSHYYDAKSAVDLKDIFHDITSRILKLKITS